MASAVALSPVRRLPAEDLPYLVVDGKEVAVPYVLKIGDEKISMEEYRYYYLNTKAQAEMYMGSISGRQSLRWLTTSKPLPRA